MGCEAYAHVVLQLRISGGVHPLPCMLSWHVEEQLYFLIK